MKLYRNDGYGIQLVALMSLTVRTNGGCNVFFSGSPSERNIGMDMTTSMADTVSIRRVSI